jgi:hypothetical protein
MSAYAGKLPDVQRFIAVSYNLQVVPAEPQLQQNWESVIDFCATIRCEILNSSITSRTRESLPSASITLHVAPEDVPKLIEHLEKQGTIVQHNTESDDKTTAVVDTEARIKNLTGFRDNLRAMLAKPSATVKDSVDTARIRIGAGRKHRLASHRGGGRHPAAAVVAQEYVAKISQGPARCSAAHESATRRRFISSPDRRGFDVGVWLATSPKPALATACPESGAALFSQIPHCETFFRIPPSCKHRPHR